MAATGYTPIYLYYSGTSTHVPLVANLGNGELAINAADGNLFYKNTSNALVTVPLLQSSGSQNGWLSSTDWTTFNNKQPAGSYALTTGTLAQFASTTSAQLAGVISDETGTGSLVFATSPTIATPTLTGDATLSTGNLVVGTSGKGIDFSATPGTGTSELLTDYEEGTWTPVLTTSTPPTTPFTMSVVYAVYTKVGRQVTVTARIRTTNVSLTGADGVAYISGLPYTSSTDGSGTIGYSSAWATNQPTTCYASGTFVYLYYRATSSGATTNVLYSDITAGASTSNNLYFTITYFV